MPLLTDTQIAEAAKDALLCLIRAVNAQLRVLEHDDLVLVTRRALAEQGADSARNVVIGVDEWDDGYFYSGVIRVQDVDGNELTLGDEALARVEGSDRAGTHRALVREQARAVR